MKNILSLLSLFFISSIYAQDIEFIEVNDTLQNPKYQEFIYVSENTDISASIYVAKIKATGSLKNLTALFLKIKSEAQNLGANSFVFESFKKTDAENGELILSAYFNGEAFFEENFKNIPKNKIFVFGNQNLTSSSSQGYKVNGERFEIEPGKFKEFEINPEKETKINKGGFTGMSLWITAKEEGYSSFLSFSGIGIVGGSVSSYGGVGINISTGAINRVEANLALLLLKIYAAQN